MFKQIRNLFRRPVIYIEEKSKETPPLGKIDTTRMSSMSGILSFDDRNPDEILKRQGADVYDEMEAKDSHLYSVYQTRKLALSLIPWDILPASSSSRDKMVAEFVFTVIDDIKGPFPEDIRQLLDAIGKGFSILEIIYKQIGKGKFVGKWGIEELLFHKQKYWFFKDRRWHKADESVVLYRDETHGLKGEEVPWEKIVHYAFDAQDNLYGRAAFKPLYWPYWFKKEGWKLWMVFLDKYGSPTAVGHYPPGTKPNERTVLMDAIEAIQKETGITIPDNMKISFLEASHVGPASYSQLKDACNTEISKGILGATQAVEEGRRGSYALSRAHSEVRKERVESDAIDIADTIQEQIVKRIVDYNFIVEHYPQFIMKYPWEPQKGGPGGGKAAIPGQKDQPSGPAADDILEPDNPAPVGRPQAFSVGFARNLKRAFASVQDSIEKQLSKDKKPVVNVGPIRKALFTDFGNEDSFTFARKVKEFIEPRILEDSDLNETILEAYAELEQEAKCLNI